MNRVFTYLLALSVTCLFATRSEAALSENAKAHVLAGSSQGVSEPEALTIEQSAAWKAAAMNRSVMSYWNTETLNYPGISKTPNLVSPSHFQMIRAFSKTSLTSANANTARVLYPFGGPDFAFPNMFFPQMRTLMLIGLENVGDLPDVETMSHSGQLTNVMREIADAYVYLPERSYFVTRRMAVMLKQFGVTTMLSVGLAVAGNQIYDVKHVSLDRTGKLIPDTVNGPHGVVIRYVRPDGQPGSVIYFRQDLSNSGLQRIPEFESFLRNMNFDTAFYKAAQGLSSSPNFSKIDQIVLGNVRYVVESDDGIAFRSFSQNPSVWRTKVFGLYARPNSGVLGDRFQADLLQDDALGVCSSGNAVMIHDFERIWSSRDICKRFAGRTQTPGVTWGGFIPFPYGYGYRLTPVPQDLHSVTSNIIYAERK
jgi:hypothetical protein